MAVNSASVHKAIVGAWNAGGLEHQFKALWDSSAKLAEYQALNDQEAAPTQPFPYCVVQQTSSTTTDRMTGGENALQEVRDVDVTFQVHARAIDGDSRTAKEIAADLAEEIEKVFGGHPTVRPQQTLQLDSGAVLLVQYTNDYGVRTGDNEYMWAVVYTVRVDVPVAV